MMIFRINCVALLAVLIVAAQVAQAAAPTPEKAAAKIDKLLAGELFSGSQPEPAGQADDETFLRRVTLDITGQLPTPGEVTAFVLDPAKDKRARVVEKLLAREDYGTNWGRYWRDVIMFRRSDDRAGIAAGPLQGYFTEALNENKPWDEVATDLITAEGDVTKDGRTGLIMAQLGQPEDTVAEISRIFLGIQIQCAQCHDHKTDRWTREQFHELAAFFPRVAARPDRSSDKRTFLVVSTDAPMFRRANGNNRYRGTPEHFMKDLENPQARGQRMQPIFFINDEKLDFGTNDEERRETLAKWLTATDNEWFANALVNRMWSELVGEGFYEPVDDMGPDRDATAPATLDYLSAQFSAGGYDVKWLFTTIIATDAYQRDSRPRRRFNETPMTANCQQRLRGDQLFNALTKALGIREPQVRSGGDSYAARLQQLRGPRGQFSLLFAYDPSDPRDDVAGSIPQALLLMNSPQINTLISASPYTPLGKLLRETPDNEDVVYELYLRCLARQPSEREMRTSLQYVKQVGDRNEAFEDLLWALVNSTEFLHRR